MGVRILSDTNGITPMAALYCSTSMWAFGPIFDSVEEAEAFLTWLQQTDGRDARRLSDNELENAFAKFHTDCPHWRKEGVC